MTSPIKQSVYEFWNAASRGENLYLADISRESREEHARARLDCVHLLTSAAGQRPQGPGPAFARLILSCRFIKRFMPTHDSGMMITAVK